MSLPDLDDDAPAFRTRSTWPIVAVMVVLAGVGGYFAWRFTTAPEPRRVLVAIDFDGHWFAGSRPAALLADELNARLETLGFQPVRAGDPEVTEALQTSSTLPEAARKLKAAFIVTGTLTPTVIEHPVGGGYFEVRAAGAVEVQHIEDEAPVSVPIRGWSGARERDRALDILASESIALQAIGAALPPLLEHPTIAALLEGDARTIVDLQPAAKFVAARTRQLSQAKDAYAAYAGRRQDAEKGPVEITYHGTTAAEDGLLGTGPRGYLVKTENTQPYVSPRTLKLRLLEDLETVEWRTLEGERTVLWSGYNVFSYPGVSKDGSVVAMVEDLFGWAKALTRIGPDGEPRRLILDEAQRFSSPEPSAEGTFVAAYARTCRRCPDALLVVDAEGKTRLRAENEGGRFDGFTWLDDRRLAVLHTPVAPPPEGEQGAEAPEEAAAPPDARVFPAVRQTLWIIDVSAEPPRPVALRPSDEGEHLSWMSADRRGERLAFRLKHPEGSGLAVLTLADGALTRLIIPGKVSSPRFSPAGAWLTFNFRPTGKGADEEIAVMPTAGGPVKVLTDNDTRDRYPTFDHTGKRIYFESLGKDPNHPKRHVALIASIPFEP